MEASESSKKIADAQKKMQEAKAPEDSAEKTNTPPPQHEDEDENENPFGGLSSRNLKKNLGCGG